MRICLPTQGNQGLKEQVHNHFGSATYFTVYDTETKQAEAVANGNQHHSHGACQPLHAIAQLGVDVVLTGGMGARAIAILNEGGIKIYQLEGGTVEETVNKFLAGELPELTAENGCHGHGCH